MRREKLKEELSRAQDDRDILKKKQPRTSRKALGKVRIHLRASGPVCGAAAVPRVGRRAQWVLCVGEAPPSQPSKDDDCLLGLIGESHEASGRTYGATRILCDPREVGECVGKNRIGKFIKRHNKIRAQRGY